MSARVDLICRHPIKGHGREELASVALAAGEGLPWDRFWAVAHEAAKLREGWSPCVNFARGAKAPALMAITCRLDEGARAVTLSHPGRGELRFRPDDLGDVARFLDWVRPLNPPDRAQPVRIVTGARAMTDSDWPSVSVLSLASLADLSARMGIALSPHRFRGNLWVEGWEPWAEFGMIGRRLRIGDAVLEVRERITRCRATCADVETGELHGDTLAALHADFGHQDFGLYAAVVQGGTVTAGQEVVLQ